MSSRIMVASLVVATLPPALPAAWAVDVKDRPSATPPVVDVPIDISRRLPVTEVMVNGQGPFKFVVDTGAGGTVVTSRLAKKLSLPVKGQAFAGAPTGQPPVPVDLVDLEAITIGEVEFQNVMGVAMDLSSVFVDGDVPDGILGFRLFEDYLMILDLPGRRLRLDRGKLPSADEVGIVSYTLSHGMIPAIPLRVADLTFEAHLDTGNRGAITMPSSNIDKLSLESKPVKVRDGRAVNNTFEITGSRLRGTAAFGDHVIENPDIHFTDVMPTANIGFEALKPFVMTIDQKNRRIRFQRRHAEDR